MNHGCCGKKSRMVQSDLKQFRHAQRAIWRFVCKKNVYGTTMYVIIKDRSHSACTYLNSTNSADYYQTLFATSVYHLHISSQCHIFLHYFALDALCLFFMFFCCATVLWMSMVISTHSKQWFWSSLGRTASSWSLSLPISKLTPVE